MILEWHDHKYMVCAMYTYEVLSTIDWLVLAIWLFVSICSTLVIGLKNFTKDNSDDSYILMARKLTLPLFIATLVASWYGGLFGVTQVAFEHGIYNFITQGVFWYIAYLIFAFFLVKRIHKEDAITFPDLIKKIFGERSAKFSAIILVFKSLPISYSLGLGAFIQTICGYSLPTSIIMGTSIVTIYTAIGNFKTIVYSDFIQFCFMYIGVVMVVIFAYYNIGSPLTLIEQLPHHYFQIQGKHNYSTMLLWLFIACTATIISPVFYQRCMSAKTSKIAKSGIIISIFFWIIFDICTTLGGMYAKLYLPEANSLNAYLEFGIAILPSGARGMFVAACMATIISTLDSFIFASSILISHNLIPEKLKFSNIHRIASVIIVGFITVSIALVFDTNIENIWLAMEGYCGALLMVPVLWSYCIKAKIPDLIFIITTVVSLLIMLAKDLLFPGMMLESFYLGMLATLLCYALYQALIKTYRVI